MAWNKITWTKELGVWGLGEPKVFTKALDAKGPWRILKGEGLWVKVVYYKYIHPLSIEEWFREANKSIRIVSPICRKH